MKMCRGCEEFVVIKKPTPCISDGIAECKKYDMTAEYLDEDDFDALECIECKEERL